MTKAEAIRIFGSKQALAEAMGVHRGFQAAGRAAYQIRRPGDGRGDPVGSDGPVSVHREPAIGMRPAVGWLFRLSRSRIAAEHKVPEISGLPDSYRIILTAETRCRHGSEWGRSSTGQGPAAACRQTGATSRWPIPNPLIGLVTRSAGILPANWLDGRMPALQWRRYSAWQ